MMLRPAVLSRLLPDRESSGANDRTTIDRDQARSGIDIQSYGALKFRRRIQLVTLRFRIKFGRRFSFWIFQRRQSGRFDLRFPVVIFGIGH